MRGQRVQLTAEIESLGVTAHPGDQGTVIELHTPDVDPETGKEHRYLTVQMDDGRIQHPRTDEATVLPDGQP
ncbi:hypothetical protein [Streptomyces sp. NPDC037389]|uniref:hypothetical protein n=1 Tax=Streptomyces sp. NPDC037389 TaxID=3155369 RepID=UPI0033CFEE6C